jgi:hypothetical protein
VLLVLRCLPLPPIAAPLAHAVEVVFTVSVAVTALAPLTVVLGTVKQAFAIEGLLVTA